MKTKELVLVIHKSTVAICLLGVVQIAAGNTVFEQISNLSRRVCTDVRTIVKSNTKSLHISVPERGNIMHAFCE